jgi:transcription antitermination factor NusG
MAFDLPHVPHCGHSFMRVDGVLTRIADRELEPLRKIAEKPLVKARDLPRPGARVRFNEGPFEGLRGKVLACSQRYASVTVEGFSQPIQVPPCLLLKI